MVASCCAFNCNNRKDRTSTLTFHSFPQDPDLRKKWIIAINRKNFNPSPHARLCSKHFAADQFQIRPNANYLLLNPGAIPSIFDSHVSVSTPPTTKRKAVKKFGLPVKNPTKKGQHEPEASCSLDQTGERNEGENVCKDQPVAETVTSSSLFETYPRPTVCCARGCNNTGEIWQMIFLPKHTELRKKWLERINVCNWIPNDSSALCEIHFEDDMWERDITGEKLIRPDAVPSLFLEGKNSVTTIDLKNLRKQRKLAASEIPAQEIIEIEESSIFIKQEILEPKEENRDDNETSPNEESSSIGFEDVGCENPILKQAVLGYSEGSTILEPPHHVEIKTEPAEYEEDSSEFHSDPSSSWKGSTSLVSEEKVEYGRKRTSLYTECPPELAKKRREDSKTPMQITQGLQTTHGASSSPIMSVREPSNLQPSQHNLAFPQNVISPNLIMAPVTDADGRKKFLLMVAKQASSQIGQQSVPPFALSNSPPPPQPPAPTLIDCSSISEPDSFTVSLTQFPRGKRQGVMKKVLELLDLLANKDVDPEEVNLVVCNH